MLSCIAANDPTRPTALSYTTRHSSTRLGQLTPERMQRATPRSISRIASHRIPRIPSATMAVMNQEQVDRLRWRQKEVLRKEQFLAIAQYLPVDDINRHLNRHAFHTGEYKALHDSLTGPQQALLYGRLRNFDRKGKLRFKDVYNTRYHVLILALHGLYQAKKEAFFRAYLEAFQDCTDYRHCPFLGPNLVNLYNSSRDYLNDEALEVVLQLLKNPHPIYAFLRCCTKDLRETLEAKLPAEVKEAIDGIQAEVDAENARRQVRLPRGYRSADGGGTTLNHAVQIMNQTAVMTAVLL